MIYAWRSFEAYPLLAALAGATSVQVPLRGETHDLAAMAAAVTPRTRIILVCNPNNPTGTVVAAAELSEFLDQVPGDVLVVLDEAYREYIRDDASQTAWTCTVTGPTWPCSARSPRRTGWPGCGSVS